MGIISIKSTDNLFWLGRYIERVNTTLKIFTEYYDRMIDKDEKYYEDFCSKLGIANKYSYKQEFIRNFLFDENDPNSVMHNLLAAYDNAVIMRNELSSETMSYVQMAVDALEKDKYSNAPILKLQQVFDYIFAFWGSADDYVESETSRNILKFGRSVERLDLYTRFSYPPELVKKEFSILLNRLYKVGIECNVDATDRLISIILEKDSFEEDKNIILNETAIVGRAKENSDVDMDYIYIMLQTAPIQNALLKLINDKGKATPKLSKEMLNMIHIIKLTEEERTKIIEEHRRIQEETIRFQNTIDKLQTTDENKMGMIWVQSEN